MNAEDKSKTELIKELAALRQQVAELQAVKAQQARAAQALRTSEATLRTLLESASDGIMIVKANGQIALANARIEELFGYRRHELLGQPVEMLLPTRFRQAHPGHRAGYLARPRPRPMGQGLTLTGQRKDGSEFPVEVGLSPVETEVGNLVMALIADITERVRAQQELQRRALELQARNEELDAFAHTVAHDLQNSLALIIGASELLSDDLTHISKEELYHQLLAIARNGRKMSNIIDELLLLASVRQMADVKTHTLDMGNIVAEAQRRLVDLITTHQAEIVVPQAWPPALGYGPWIEEIWVNYLSNAIHYGGDPPHLELGFSILNSRPSLAASPPQERLPEIRNPKPKMVRFWVRDNGPGITPGEQAHLFRPFTQLGQARADGHGLGLSIVRRIVTRLGGQVGVESEVGRGSVFSFTLPAAER